MHDDGNIMHTGEAEHVPEQTSDNTGEALAKMLMLIASNPGHPRESNDTNGLEEVTMTTADTQPSMDEQQEYMSGTDQDDDQDDEKVAEKEEEDEEESSLDSFASRPYYSHRLAEAAAAAAAAETSSNYNTNRHGNTAVNKRRGGSSTAPSTATALTRHVSRPGFRSSLSKKSGNHTHTGGGNGGTTASYMSSKKMSAPKPSNLPSADQARGNGPDDYANWIPRQLSKDRKVRDWYKQWYAFTYKNYHKNLPSTPTKINYELVDLYNLYFAVCKRGGYSMLEKDKWRDIIKETINYDPHSTTVVRKTRVVGHYEKLLLNYEQANPQDVTLPSASGVKSNDTTKPVDSSQNWSLSHRPRRIKSSGRTLKRALKNSNSHVVQESDNESPSGKAPKRIRGNDAVSPISPSLPLSQYTVIDGKRLGEWTVDELCEYLRPYVKWKTVLLVRRNEIDGSTLDSMIKVFPHEILSEGLAMDLLKWMKLYVQLSKHI